MTIKEKLQWIILPALFVIAIGIVEINFPHAMEGFDDAYTGRGLAGFILLIFELFLTLTWGKIEGIILILLGMIPIVLCFSPSSDTKSDTKNKIIPWQLGGYLLSSPLTFKTAKFVWKRRNKIPVEKQQQILNVAKKLSEPETRQLINQTATNLAQQYLQKNNDTNNAYRQDEPATFQTETNIQIEELVIESVASDNKKIEISNEAEEKEETIKIIDQVANELAKNYLEKETNNTQDTVNISDSKTKKAIAQTAKTITKSYLEEISKTEEVNKTQ